MTALQNSPRITPFLWFDSNAEEAVDFYLSIFKNSHRAQGQSPHHRVRARRPKIHSPQWRSNVQIHRSRLVSSALRFAGRSRLLLVKTPRWRHRKPMRLAQGQVRPVLANRPLPTLRTNQAPQSHASHDENEKTRHRRTRTRSETLTDRLC
jgi:hypothetical protein